MRTLRSPIRGASLVELIVSSFIVGILMLEIWRLVAAGSQFYRKVRSQGDVQRESLLALRWIARDLSSGSTISFREYKTEGTNPAVNPGIVFGSPNVIGTSSISYDPNGRMQWASVIGYFIRPQDNTLYRQQIPLAAAQTFPPVIDNDTQSTDVLAGLPGPRVVARHIHEISTTQGPKDIKIQLSTRDEELGFGIKVRTRLEMKN